MAITDRLTGFESAQAIKTPCRCASTANVTLSGSTQIIDGVTPSTGDRVLVWQQSSTADNGIWIVQSSSWARAKDFDGSRDAMHGTMVLVSSEGTAYGNKFFTVTSTGDNVPGTDNITFAELGINPPGITSFGSTLITAANASSARSILGMSTSTGTVAGPASSTVNSLAQWNSTNGEVLKDGAVIGTDVQAYDADTAKLDVDQSWTGSQRATPVTDNDGSFDMNAGQDFNWTPTGADTLEFTNETSGQRGMIRLVNGSNYTISLGAEVKAPSGTATALSATGTYLISYWCYDGTNVAISWVGPVA